MLKERDLPSPSLHTFRSSHLRHTMKSVFWGFLFLLAALAFWWLGRPASSTPDSADQPTPTAPQSSQPAQRAANVTASSAPAPITSPAQVQAVLTPAQPGTFKRIEAPPPPPVKIPAGYQDPPTEAAPARLEGEELALNLRNFSQRFGGNPVGTNAEITKALNGGNDAAANYLPSSRRTSAAGELLDYWGTPYFFHANSATEMEIRSAGPDKILHNADDIVTK